MCGFVTLLATSGQQVSGAVLRRMTQRLAHRGPDDIGFACVDPSSGAIRTWGQELPDEISLSGVIFGHRRLSILDLSPAGHQPMVSSAGSVLCFNGEIYNFLELRRRLAADGVSLRGTGDTEVLLAAYDRWGLEALPRLNGMWAFVLWDGVRRTVVACRDRFGVKPLYYTTVDGVQVFGSEIKAVLEHPGAHRGFEQRQVAGYLRDGLTDHTAQTMFCGIRSLSPGTSIVLGDGRSTTERYWSLPGMAAQNGRAPEGLTDEFRDLLTDAVGLRVRSDVPIGTMMSGGLDSTAIAALIKQHQRAPEAGRTFDGLTAFHHTFSACWPGWFHDEEAEVDAMSAHLGVACHKLYPTAETIADTLPALAYQLDEPFFDPVASVQSMLMQQARAHGAKVVLNGHGSDEILAGYHRRFVPVRLAHLLWSGRARDFYREQRAFGGTGWTWPEVFRQALTQVAPDAVGLALPHAQRLKETLRGGSVLVEWLDDRRPDESHFPTAPPGLTPLGAALWLQFSSRNVPRWLRMEDRVSMAWGVESRLPFFDYRLVEFAFALPDDLKLRDGYSKHILREAMRDLVPARLVDARVKRQFLTPFTRWLRGPWRAMIVDLLSTRSEVAPFLNQASFQGRLQSFMAGSDRSLDPNLLWRVLSVELWMRAFAAGSSTRIGQ